MNISTAHNRLMYVKNNIENNTIDDSDIFEMFRIVASPYFEFSQVEGNKEYRWICDTMANFCFFTSDDDLKIIKEAMRGQFGFEAVYSTVCDKIESWYRKPLPEDNYHFIYSAFFHSRLAEQITVDLEHIPEEKRDKFREYYSETIFQNSLKYAHDKVLWVVECLYLADDYSLSCVYLENYFLNLLILIDIFIGSVKNENYSDYITLFRIFSDGLIYQPTLSSLLYAYAWCKTSLMGLNSSDEINLYKSKILGSVSGTYDAPSPMLREYLRMGFEFFLAFDQQLQGKNEQLDILFVQHISDEDNHMMSSVAELGLSNIDMDSWEEKFFVNN